MTDTTREKIKKIIKAYLYKNPVKDSNEASDHISELLISSGCNFREPLSICPHCNCMTKNVCGKCKKVKGEKDE